jgi:hypothetical protein
MAYVFANWLDNSWSKIFNQLESNVFAGKKDSWYEKDEKQPKEVQNTLRKKHIIILKLVFLSTLL